MRTGYDNTSQTGTSMNSSGFKMHGGCIQFLSLSSLEFFCNNDLICIISFCFIPLLFGHCVMYNVFRTWFLLDLVICCVYIFCFIVCFVKKRSLNILLFFFLLSFSSLFLFSLSFSFYVNYNTKFLLWLFLSMYFLFNDNSWNNVVKVFNYSSSRHWNC